MCSVENLLLKLLHTIKVLSVVCLILHFSLLLSSLQLQMVMIKILADTWISRNIEENVNVTEIPLVANVCG